MSESEKAGKNYSGGAPLVLSSTNVQSAWFKFLEFLPSNLKSTDCSTVQIIRHLMKRFFCHIAE